MQSKREQAFVGLFVLIAVAVLFGTVFAMSGAYGDPEKVSCVVSRRGGGRSSLSYRKSPRDSIQLDRRIQPAGVVFACNPTFPSKSTAA